MFAIQAAATTESSRAGMWPDRIHYLAQRALEKERSRRELNRQRQKKLREERRRLAILNGEPLPSSNSSMTLRSDSRQIAKSLDRNNLTVDKTQATKLPSSMPPVQQPTQGTECQTANPELWTADNSPFPKRMKSVSKVDRTPTAKERSCTPATTQQSVLQPPNPKMETTKRKESRADEPETMPTESQTVERVIAHNPKYILGGKSVDVKPEPDDVLQSAGVRKTQSPNVKLPTAADTEDNSIAKTQTVSRTQRPSQTQSSSSGV